MKHCVKLLIAAIVLSGCATVKKTSYLLDMAYDTSYPAKPAPELVLQEGDRIDIQVMSLEPELSAPFHVPGADGKYQAEVYTVGRDGSIDFPVLGRLDVKGLTLKETERLIGGIISDKGLIRQPTVRVNMDNFVVTVIGQSGNSVVPVQGGSINILQAIASTGGIKGNSDIRNIMVVRTVGGERTAYSVDLQSKTLFDSPVFYLQQNDVVYIKPRGTSMSSTGQTILGITTAGLSLLTIISNFILWSSYR